MADFNRDNLRLDGALPKIAVGFYTGDGNASRLISLGFTPRAVLVMQNSSEIFTQFGAVFGGLAVTDSPTYYTKNIITIESTGFKVYSDGGDRACTNQSGCTYNYLALG